MEKSGALTCLYYHTGAIFKNIHICLKAYTEINMNKIIMLGTGHATVTKCYNTCFIVKSSENMLLVDAGGGNGILRQLEAAGIDIADIHNLFVTHAHTDHILGVIWVIRMVMQKKVDGKYEGNLNLYGNDKVVNVIDKICNMILHKNYEKQKGKTVILHKLSDGDEFSLGSMRLQCFDILSKKEKQYGFTLHFADGTRLVCFGDEPCNDHTLHYAQGTDWMMCEAFCLYSDRERFHPYEKCHSTALDAGKIAQELGVKNLVVYHTEDTDLYHRKQLYTHELSENYHGNIFVPDDLETITL